MQVPKPRQFFELVHGALAARLVHLKPLSVLFENHVGVSRRELHELFLLSLLRHHEPDARAALRGEPVGEEGAVRKFLLEPDFLRDEGRPGVELFHEALEQFPALIFHCNVEIVVLASHNSALADKEDLHHRFPLISAERDDVSVLHALRGHLLPLLNVLDAAEQIPEFTRALKFHARRRILHLLFQLSDRRLKLSVQKVERGVHIRAVGLLAHITRARCAALVNVIVEAGSLLADVPRQHALAIPKLKRAVHKVQRLSHRLRRTERPEVFCLVFLHLPRHEDPRKRLPDRHLDIRIGLVIPEHRVVARAILLD